MKASKESKFESVLSNEQSDTARTKSKVGFSKNVY